MIDKKDFVVGTIIDYNTSVYYKLVEPYIVRNTKKIFFKLKFVDKESLKELNEYASGLYSFEQVKTTKLIRSAANLSFKDKVIGV